MLHSSKLTRTCAGFIACALLLPVVTPALAQVPAETSLEDRFKQAQVVLQQNVEVRNDFQLSPTRFEFEMSPGEERTVEISVTSRMGKNSVFALSTEDFAAGENENETTKLFGLNEGPYSAKRWLTPVVRRIELRQAERAYIPVTIKVPLDADAGDHYGAVLVQRELDKDEAGSLSVISRVGALFLITVKGNVVQKGTVTNIASALKLYWYFPVRLNMSSKNDGSVRMAPAGTVQIKNILGVVVDEVPVTQWLVLRNSSRNFAVEWKPRFALGRYTATTNLKIFGQPTEAVSVSFWVIPALPVLLALLAIFVVSFLVQFFFSRFEIKKKDE